MPVKPHIYTVNPVPGSRYRLVVRGVDYALRLFDTQDELVSVNNMNLVQFKQNDLHPWLALKRLYLIRYNNNDGGNGNLNLSIVQYYPDSDSPLILRNFDLNDILGPQVMEIPFILALPQGQ